MLHWCGGNTPNVLVYSSLVTHLCSQVFHCLLFFHYFSFWNVTHKYSVAIDKSENIEKYSKIHYIDCGKKTFSIYICQKYILDKNEFRQMFENNQNNPNLLRLCNSRVMMMWKILITVWYWCEMKNSKSFVWMEVDWRISVRNFFIVQFSFIFWILSFYSELMYCGHWNWAKWKKCSTNSPEIIRKKISSTE